MPMPIAHDQPQQQSIIQKSSGDGCRDGGRGRDDSVSIISGFLFGGFAIISRGAGPRGPLNTLATYMASSGGTFAFFMFAFLSHLSSSFLKASVGWASLKIDNLLQSFRSIGSVIRTESHHSLTSPQLAALQFHWRSRQQYSAEKPSAQ
ncbi:hypothetical protein VP01_313g4 [Puccinia sorghi]|uniref:Uncharacterized protein n=1 Tax=Puccinia sorghi TaxID=27349 RepID=A0A0L6UZ63_9BASI|nr:hypothetical protein VP01_313g4 [Puccinia sorghi]